MVVVETSSLENKLDPSISPRRRVWRKFLRYKIGVVSLTILAFVALLAILAPWVAPFPNDANLASHTERRFLPPGTPYWFGTDQLGRDVLTRVIFGGRISLTIGLLAVFTSTFIGTLGGLVAGFWVGYIDDLIMRVADIFLGVPSLVLAMLVALTFGGGTEATVIAIAITWWPRYARLIRGEVIRIKVQEYVQAARALGANPIWILAKHIFPGTLPVLIVQASLQMGQAILVAAALGFIGLGARPPSPEWGLSVAIGREYLPDVWWMSFFPGILIFITVVSLNLVGDGLRITLDTKIE